MGIFTALIATGLLFGCGKANDGKEEDTVEESMGKIKLLDIVLIKTRSSIKSEYLVFMCQYLFALS